MKFVWNVTPISIHKNKSNVYLLGKDFYIVRSIRIKFSITPYEKKKTKQEKNCRRRYSQPRLVSYNKKFRKLLIGISIGFLAFHASFFLITKRRYLCPMSYPGKFPSFPENFDFLFVCFTCYFFFLFGIYSILFVIKKKKSWNRFVEERCFSQ